MKQIKIVQSGDFHLDSPLSQHHLSFRPKRREELLHTFKNVIDFAIKEKADLLLLAGDLFDSTRVTSKTLDFMIKNLSRFKGRVFISPGNHDPYEKSEIYADVEFPKNTHMFKEYEEVFLEDLDCVVCGKGFAHEFCHDNMLENITAPSQPSLKILLMHGEVSKGEHGYNPITKESIKASGFNYIALGHRHDFSGIMQEGKTSYGYAGIPEGRGFDEQGDKGVVYGKIYEHGVNLEFKPICLRIYQEINVNVSSCITTLDFFEKIKLEIKNKKTIYKIKLMGKLPSYITVNLKDLDKDLRDILEDFSLYDETTVEITSESFGKRSIQQHFIHAVEKKKKQLHVDQELLDEVKNMGLRILSQEKF